MQPVDLQIDARFDLTCTAVQHAIGKVFPSCHLSSAAIDCSTKSHTREVPLPGTNCPKPLRSLQQPRGIQ